MPTPLESLKLKLADRAVPTPLWVPLYIYSKATKECYIEYMEGFKLLIDWLGEIEYPELSSLDKKFSIPSIFRTYDLQEIAKILSKRSRIKVHYIEQHVYIAMTNQVIPRLARV